MINQIKLYKKTPFDDVIYYTTTGIVKNSIREILNSLTTDTDMLCNTSEILADVIKELTIQKTFIDSNSDFNRPIPRDMIKDKMVIVKGCYTTGDETYNKITQIAFNYYANKTRITIRMGVINNE